MPILLEVFKETSCDVEELINQYVEMYKSLSQPEEVGRRLDELKRKWTWSRRRKASYSVIMSAARFPTGIYQPDKAMLK